MNLAYFVDSGLLYERLILFPLFQSVLVPLARFQLLLLTIFVSYLFSYETKFANVEVLLL